MKFSRRTVLEVLGAGALTPVAAVPLAAAQVPAPPKEGKDTPKIALGMGDGGGGRGGCVAYFRSHGWSAPHQTTGCESRIERRRPHSVD